MSPRLMAVGAPEDSVYHAQPYNIDACGFYFTSMEEYETKSEGHTDCYGNPVEEYELQFIDGDNYRLFNALSINQATLQVWFDQYADLDPDKDDYWKVIYLADNGYSLDQIPSSVDDIIFYHGSAVDYAEEIVSECYDVPSALEYYIDYKAFARDMELNGDFTIFETDMGDVVVFGP